MNNVTLKSDFVTHRVISEKIGNLLIFREKVLHLRPKSVCAVEMTMYVHWTCMNVNIKDVHEYFNDFI